MAGRNPLIRPKPKQLKGVQENKSAGILDDFAVRKNVATREGTIEKTPVNDVDIANKKYVDDEITAESAVLSAEIDADIATHTAITDAHHAKYTDAEAVSAVSTADDYLKNDGDTATGDYNFSSGTLFIDHSEGNVGIGTTSPGAQLEVVGSARVTDGDSKISLTPDTSSLDLTNAAVVNIFGGSNTTGRDAMVRFRNEETNVDWLLGQDATDNALRIWNENKATPFVTILDNTGKVGIKTTSPTSNLHVVGLPVYANNAAAVAGGLTAGAFYRTGGDPDPVCVVH